MVNKYKFLIYGRSSCPFCVRAEQMLKFKKQECQFFDLENDRQFLEEAKIFYQHNTVPIVLSIDKDSGKVSKVGGSDDLKEWLRDTL